MSEFGLILASASPRRRQLLEQFGLPFRIQHADIDERVLASELPVDYVDRLAFSKAKTVRQQGNSGAVIIGSDTCVVADNEILGKPEDFQDARRMLLLLSDRWHHVFTAVTVLSPEGKWGVVVDNRVKFRSLEEDEIERYWKTGEPQDKAGSYAVQGIAGVFIERIEGSFSAIVGLPLCETADLLSQAGVSVWSGQ